MPSDQSDVRPKDAVHIAQRALGKAAILEEDIRDLERDINQLRAETRELDQSLDGDDHE